MKKVLVIAPYPYLPYFSGGQKFIARFLHYLGGATALTVVSTKGNDAAMADTYRLLPLLGQSSFRYADIRLIGKLSRLIREEKFDTIIWEHPYYWWLASRVKKRTGIKTLIHTHNIEYQRFRSLGKWWWPILRTYEKRCFRKADGLFFITPEDKKFAIESWQIAPEKCYDLPFGVEISGHPPDKALYKQELLHQFQLPGNTRLILFNGVLSYKPNLDALKVILDTINPVLLEQKDLAYRIIICGKNLPEEWNKLSAYKDKNVIYAGFVKKIEPYFLGADLFLNPVQLGGGVKTKMVESIAYGTTVVAVQSGATGLDSTTCGNKLIVVPDNDWTAFAQAVLHHLSDLSRTPASFYDAFYWENIIRRILLSV